MVKHCPICNRSSNEVRFFGEFCEFCTRDKLRSKIPHEIMLVECRRCGRIWVDGEYTEKNHRSIENAIKRKIRGYETRLLDYTDDAAIIELSGEEITGLREEIALEHENRTCQRDLRKSSGYYEAVVQLRGNEVRAQRIIKKLNDYLLRREQFISKIEQVENGYDAYASSKKLTSAFIAEIKLKPTVSYTLYGLRGGKKVYRNTYAIRL